MFPLAFFFDDTPSTEIYTLSLHDALPILENRGQPQQLPHEAARQPDRQCNPQATQVSQLNKFQARLHQDSDDQDRKSTRLNSSHSQISYAVFCLKKKIDTPHPATQSTRLR